MKTTSRLCALAFSIFGMLFFVIQPSFAMSVSVMSISPEPQMDISDLISDAPEGVGLVGWLLDDNVEYTAVLSVDESPAVVITPGADIALDNPWLYDEDAGTLTLIFTATGLKQHSDGPDNAAIIAVVPPVELGEDGPPVEMTGAWLSTNVQDWALIPPSEENVAFGFSLTGPAGETGFFHMFMPQGMIDLLSEMSGKTLTIQDLAIFNGDNQASMSITEVEGGAYIDINVKFSETAITSTSAGSKGVTKSITVREQSAISLSVNKTSIKNGKTIRVFGWTKDGKKNKHVTLWRKNNGESTFTKWKTVTTTKNGYYEVEFSAKTSATYKAKYRLNGKTKVSTSVSISVT